MSEADTTDADVLDNGAYTSDDVQLAAAECVGAFKTDDYQFMEGRALALLAIARRKQGSPGGDGGD